MQKVKKIMLNSLQKISTFVRRTRPSPRRAGPAVLYLRTATGYSTDRMHSEYALSTHRSVLTTLPLAVSFGAIPLATAAARLTGTSGQASPFLPWLLLAGVGTLAAMRRPAPGAPGRRGFFFGAALLLILVVGLVLHAPDMIIALGPLLPRLTELSPLVMLLLCLLWATTCGLPDRADLQRFGAFLGTLSLADLAVETAIYRAAPAMRLLGDADVLAGLLLVSLCAGLKPGDTEKGMSEPDQGRPLWRALTLIGLLACLSRPGLFAGAWVMICFGRGSLARRTAIAIVCVVLLAGTFLLPITPSDSGRFVDYWLWLESIGLWSKAPLTLLTGFSHAVPLPIDFPSGVVPIWETVTGSPTAFGVSLSQVPSFWLRATLGWGLGAPLLLLVVLIPLLLRRPTRMGAGLTAALFAQAMSTPLLFDPAMAAPVGLAFILALGTPTRKAPTRPAPVETPPDPASEWDLRPL
jgi:hypothetical protein